jgi:prepilin-type N-terminal cleavage/methylation domain-containing protein
VKGAIEVKTNKGFTMVELIITISVLGIVMLAIGSAMTAFVGRNSMFRQREQVHQYEHAARLALLGMVRDIRSSDLMLSVDNPNTLNRLAAIPTVTPALMTRINDTSDYSAVLKLALVGTVATNIHFTIFYVHVYSDVLNEYMLTRHVFGPHTPAGTLIGSPPPEFENWPVGFVSAAIDGIGITPVRIDPYAANFVEFPFTNDYVTYSNVEHLFIVIEPPTATFNIEAFQTTAALNRRPS